LSTLNQANSAEEAAQVANQMAGVVAEENEEVNDLFSWIGSWFN